MLHVVLAAKIPRATAKAMHKRNPETAITVNPRSKPDRLFHHVGFLHENRKVNETIQIKIYIIPKNATKAVLKILASIIKYFRIFSGMLFGL